jgi:xylan 1,4-beta-xylosidase
METRRTAMKLALAGTLGTPALANGGPPTSRNAAAREQTACTQTEPAWARGIEGQRQGDLGNGQYLNPIMAGSFPDPAILKDGRDYYMTSSSFEADPGLLIWHSRDLVNWTPVVAALPNPPGSVFAVDLVKHGGRYFIYIPMIPTKWSDLRDATIFVIHAENMRGPWSQPVNLGITGRIDPGHAVGEDGERYLFLSAGYRVRLSRDGLSAVGPVEKAYEGWKYPDDWITETYALEGPKILRRGDYFHLVSAVGGTGGPPTGHMVISARSRSIDGPWENYPHNPIVRTRSASEAWWSRGHASLVEGPVGDWWMLYHGYENGFRTLGRQALLEPVEWTEDGWFRALGGDLSQPIAKPRAGVSGPHGVARSDSFDRAAFGTRWTFHAPGKDEAKRTAFRNGSLFFQGAGTGPHDSAPLTNPVGDRAYEVTAHLELLGAAVGGLLLFLSNRLFVGLGIDGTKMITYGGGRVHHFREPAPAGRTMHLRIVNDRHIVTFYYSLDGRNWTRHGLRMETSGYNANTILPGEGESLRPALFAAGDGTVRFHDYRYRALS